MRRDDDYIRQLLLAAEESDDPFIIASLTINSSDSAVKKHQHAWLLSDAGLFMQQHPGVFRITSQGDDYLDAIRNDTIWTKTRETASSVGGVTVGLMRDIAVALLKQKASGILGLTL